MKMIKQLAALAVMGAFCGLAQAGQQYRVQETFIGGHVFEGILTFSDNFEKVEAVSGVLNNPAGAPLVVNGFWDSSYVTYDPHTKGLALTGPDGWPDGYVLDISWRVGSANALSLPVFVTQSWEDDWGTHYFYNNSINGSNYAIAASISAVPEPAEYGLLMAGLGVIGWAVRRRKRA